MQSEEFDSWYHHHASAFPGITSWLAGLPNPQQTLKHWEEVLKDVPLDAAMVATKEMLRNGGNIWPAQHPVEVRRIVRAKSPPSRVEEVNKMAKESDQRRAQTTESVGRLKRRWEKLTKEQQATCHQLALDRATSDFHRAFLERQRRSHERPCIDVLEQIPSVTGNQFIVDNDDPNTVAGNQGRQAAPARHGRAPAAGSTAAGPGALF